MPADDRTFGAAWDQLPPAARTSLEQAHAALVAGGLAVGSALADPKGGIVAAGRNRAYDEPGGDDPLQGTALAHAELNVLARVPTDRNMGEDTLWSTQQPCSMCDAAAAFTGVGTVCWLAADPWARAHGVGERREPGGPCRLAFDDDRWMVLASALFLISVALRRGMAHPTVDRQRELEPETHRLVRTLLADADLAVRGRRPAIDMLSEVWDAVVDVAAVRRTRTRE